MCPDAKKEGGGISFKAAMTPQEDFPTHDLDLAIVIFSFKIWRYFLYQAVFTYHKSLKYLSDKKKLNLR